MALQTTGPISIQDIKAEFKKGNNLGDYYGVAQGVPASGAISLKDFYGTSSVIVKTVTSGSLNLVLQNLFTSAEWSSATPKQVIINSGVVIGSNTTATAALRTGSGLGGTLTLVNNGSIHAAGGAANSGAGGHAFQVQVAVSIENNGAIRGGGGGGGVGGNGGNGGNGFWDQYIRDPASGELYSRYGFCDIDEPWWGNVMAYWNGSQSLEGGWNYHRGGWREEWYENDDWDTYYFVGYAIWRDRSQRNYTGGGAGGAGGAGGQGQGHNQGVSNGVAGAGGSGGGANAGWGGQGGTGGNGGNWGSPGNAGGVGNNGASGNNGGGAAGTGGANGGAAGRAILYSGGSVKWLKLGTVAGAY